MAKVKSVEVKIEPTSVIETKLGIKEGGPIHAFFTETCQKAMDKYVPASSKENLASNVRTTTDTITYPGPYAHYLYMGEIMGPNIPVKDSEGNIIRWWSKKPKYLTGRPIVFKKDTHSKATSKWDKVMWATEREKVENDVLKEIRRRAK